MLACKHLQIQIVTAHHQFSGGDTSVAARCAGQFLSVEKLSHEMGQWSGRIKPGTFAIVGGEPTLHCQLSEVIRECRRQWPFSDLQLVTNGLYFNRHPQLYQTLARTNCMISLTNYSVVETEKTDAIKELVNGWHKNHNIRRQQSKLTPHRFTTRYDSNGQMEPWSDNNPDESYARCRVKHAPHILEGKIYKCPQLAQLSLLQSKFDLPDSWRRYRNYRPLYPTCSEEELLQFFNQTVEPYCAMCPAQPRRSARKTLR